MNYDTAVIGSGGFLGGLLVGALKEQGLTVLRVTSRQLQLEEEDTVVWKYGTPPPALLKQCKIWINCAFNLAKGFQNLQDLKLLLAERVDQSFLQISTNAVLCYHRKPEDNELLYRKGGEDYARVKSAMDREVERRVPIGKRSIIFPTIVVGPGSEWASKLCEIASNERIRLKNEGDSYVDWVHIDDAVQQIVAVAHSSSLPQRKILRSQLSKRWRELILEHAAPGHDPKFEALPTNRLFFDSALPNFIFACLTSQYLPDRLAVWAFAMLRKVGKYKGISASQNCFTPKGPTRFYLSHNLGRS